jgi:hypothetical protein
MKVLFDINNEENDKVNFLKKFAHTKARTKVFKFCLNKTYDLLKEVDKK